MDAYSRNANVIKTFNAANSGLMQTLYSPGYLSPWDKSSTIRFYGFITSLRLKIDINSLPESVIPDLELTTSRTERLTAVRDLEWNAPRKQLDLFLQNTYSGSIHFASISLLNRMPYYHINLMPYLTDNLSFDVGNDTILEAQCVDVGHGLLQGSDNLSVFGSVKEEAVALPSERQEITYATDFDWTIGTESQVILPANAQRLQATFINRSTENIYLSYSPVAQAGKGITLIKGGGSYEINLSNHYKGAISAISEAPAALTGIEGV
jgi:hypothetical protein